MTAYRVIDTYSDTFGTPQLASHKLIMRGASDFYLLTVTVFAVPEGVTVTAYLCNGYGLWRECGLQQPQMQVHIKVSVRS